jgi:hypothetical protein
LEEDDMTDQNSNPFVLPGMGQASGEAAVNPLLASMEMMRQAWAGLTGPGGLAQSLPMTPPMNLQDLEKRIAELRTVESWLRMNLSMLSSTIQGMEVQRSTIATLRSFVDGLGAQGQGAGGWGDASPLEVALGLKPAPRSHAAGSAAEKSAAGRSAPRRETPEEGEATAGQAAQAPGEPDEAAEPSTHDAAPAGAPPRGAGTSPGAEHAAPGVSSAASAQAISQAAQSASEAWWGMLQQQFNQLAAATAATMPGGAAGGKPPGTGSPGEPADGGQKGAKAAQGAGGTAAKSKPAAARDAAAPAAKATSRKTAARKNKIQSGPDQS